MGIFDVFTETTPGVVNNNPAPQPAQQPTPPGNIPDPNAPPVAPGDGTTPPNAAAAPTEPPKDESPLAEFNDLWETKPNDLNTPEPTAPTQVSAEDIQKVVDTADFTSALNPEVLAAVSAGGEGAEAALQSALNAVARKVMVQSTLVNNKITEQAVAKAIEAHSAAIPGLLRKQAATDHLNTSNPLFQNPAIKPVIEATQTQLAAKFPNATAAELTEMTQNYIVAMGETFAPKAPVNDAGPAATDWEAFLQAP